MTTSAAPAVRSAPLALVHRHWRLLAFLVIGFGPFIPSLWEMREFLLADNALGFVPFALPLALYLLWLRAHGHDGPAKRDVLLDLFFAAPLIVIAFFVLLVTPARLSWYFWLNRMDLLALGFWVTATGLLFFGYQQMLRLWPAFLMAFAIWPYPMVWLQRQIGPLFVDVTAWFGRATVGFLALPYEIGADREVFTSTHLPADENFILVVGQLCSGTAATIGFLVVGVALALMMHGPPGRRLWWLGTGLALAFVSNLIRVAVLLIVASRASREVAVNEVHPVLGLILFSVVVVVMLALIRAFGLRFDPVPRGDRLVWEPVEGGGTPLRVVWVLAVAGAVGMGAAVVQAQEFNFIGIGEGAPAVAIDSPDAILPQIPGWELEHLTEVSWTDLFGRTSRGDIFEYHAPNYAAGDPYVGVQTIVTEDKATLDRYTLEQCIDFHGRTVEGRTTVDLGHGVVGVLLHETFNDVPSSTLYWVMPVNVDGEMMHARIALLNDVNARTRLEGPAGEQPSQPRGTPGIVGVGQRLEDAFDGVPSSDDGARAELDRGLLELAVQIVDTMVQTGGPAAQPPADAPAEATPAP